MLDYKYPNIKYDEWFEELTNHIENKFGGTLVEIEDQPSGILYESFRKLMDEDYNYHATIVINQDLYPRTRLYALLHEAGHLQRMADDSYQATFFYQYLDSAPDNKRYRVRTLIEEVLAWHKAESIAEDLGIDLEPVAWRREVENAIKLYADWCIKQGENNE